MNGATPTVALLLAIPSLILAIAGLVNGFTTRREVGAKTEQAWMTLTKESTDLVLGRIEELKKQNDELKIESAQCRTEMAHLKMWLVRQGIEVPNGDDMGYG